MNFLLHLFNATEKLLYFYEIVNSVTFSPNESNICKGIFIPEKLREQLIFL